MSTSGLFLFRFFGALLTMLVLAGCSRQLVSYDYDPAINFANFKSYRWAENFNSTDKDPRVENDLLQQRLKRSLDAGLSARGIQRLSEGQVDFLLAYKIGIEKRTDVDQVSTGFGFGYHFWDMGFQTDTIVREYNQITLYIDMYDPANEKLIWRGLREYRYQSGGTVAERDERIRLMVEDILTGFPPKAPAP